jgi:uncharacterized integral membrane protein
MSRFLGILSVLVVLLASMAFAAANAGHRVTIDLFLFTLYQVPVTLVAFSGLFVGMVVMFLTGIHTDLKVRRILRDRFAEESRQERTAIDKNQQDLFGAQHFSPGGSGGRDFSGSRAEAETVVEEEGVSADAKEMPEALGAESDSLSEGGGMDPEEISDRGPGEPTDLEAERQSDLQQKD